MLKEGEIIKTKNNPLKGLRMMPESNIGYDMVIDIGNGTVERVIAYSDTLIFTERGVLKR